MPKRAECARFADVRPFVRQQSAGRSRAAAARGPIRPWHLAVRKGTTAAQQRRRRRLDFAVMVAVAVVVTMQVVPTPARLPKL